MAKKASKKVSKKEEQMSEKTEKTVLVLLVIIIILLAVILGIVLFKKNNTNYKVNVDDNDGIKVTDDIMDNQTTTDNNNYIGSDSAISIALKDLKLNKNDVYDLECELDKEFNQTVYEITFNYNNLEYEYYINAESGKIIHSFKELD